MTPRPPNILLVVADQLGAAALPAYGNTVAHAPALTALGAAGTVFRCGVLRVAAVCACPSRDADQPAPVRDRRVRQRV